MRLGLGLGLGLKMRIDDGDGVGGGLCVTRCLGWVFGVLDKAAENDDCLWFKCR